MSPFSLHAFNPLGAILRLVPSHRRRGTGAATAFFLLVSIALGAPATSTGERFLSRGGYSGNLIRNANENDVKSALSAYSAIISTANNLTTDPNQLVYGSVAAMERSLRANEVDVVVAPADELLSLPDELTTPPYISSSVRGNLGVEYVILVSVDSDIMSVADLAGRRFNLLDSPLSRLGPIWLDVLCHENGLAPAATTLREIRRCPKSNLAALPVFFRQTDACLITREAFSLLCELNPQLKRGLRVLATSPRLLPLLAVMHQSISPELKAAILHTVATIDSTIAGRQLLTLFQIDRIQSCTDSDLEPTRHLLAQYSQLVPPLAPAPASAITINRP